MARTHTPQGAARSIASFGFQWLPLGILVVLWALVSGRVVSEAVLPSPIGVFAKTIQLFVTGQILVHLGVSLFRVTVGLLLGSVVGVLLGIGMARSDPVENFFDVFLTLTYPVPKTALVPLAILWLGTGTKTVVLVVFLGSLLPIVLNAYNAAGDVQKELIWSARSMGTSERDILKKIVFPASIPQITTGIRQAIPIGFIVLVSAELIAADVGVGSVILQYGSLGQYRSMFAVILIISMTAYAGVRGFERFQRRVLEWT